MGHLIRDCWCGVSYHPELNITPARVYIEPAYVPRQFRCQRAPRGWWCSRVAHHFGSCPARPRWWNVKARWKFRGMY